MHAQNYNYRIAGYFRRVFIFGYFKEAFFCENKFLGPTVLRKYIHTIKLNACLHSRDYIIFAVRMHFVALSIFQTVAALKQQKEWLSKSVPFGTFWTSGITIFANICSGEQGNSSKYMIATRCLFLFTTELILSAIFNSNLNMHISLVIKILRICNLRKFNSSKFNSSLSCENFCFENNQLYGIASSRLRY